MRVIRVKVLLMKYFFLIFIQILLFASNIKKNILELLGLAIRQQMNAHFWDKKHKAMPKEKFKSKKRKIEVNRESLSQGYVRKCPSRFSYNGTFQYLSF